MRVDGDNRAVAVTGAAEQNNFSIAMDQKIFDMLSKKIYENPEEAVLREICANAYDSNREAGKGDTPIKVVLPTRIDPVLRVRDDGLGMSHEFLMKTYTTYGSSTKDESNESIGGFGLGSKSPFAITDTFTVISRYNGKKTTYAAIIGEKGIPQINCLGSVDTDECNGVEVIVPCSESMVSAFHRVAPKVFEFYDPLPNFSGADIHDIKANRNRYSRETETFMTIDISDYSYRRQHDVRVLMGVVAYPISLDQLEMDRNVRHFAEHIGLVVKLPIGSVPLAPSRERLNYDENCIKVLSDAVSDAIGTLIDETLGRLRTINDVFDANVEFTKIRQEFSFIPEEYEFEGRKYVTEKYLKLPYGHRGISVDKKHRHEFMGERMPKGGGDYLRLHYNTNFVFVIDDVFRCFRRHERIERATYGFDTVVYVSDINISKHNESRARRRMEEAVLSLFSEFGIPNENQVIFLSETEEVKREAYHGWAKANAAGIRKIHDWYFGNSTDLINNNEVSSASEEIDDVDVLPDEALYVMMSRGIPEVTGSHLYHMASLRGLPIFLIPKSLAKKVPSSWTPMLDGLEEEIKKVRVGRYMKIAAYANTSSLTGYNDLSRVLSDMHEHITGIEAKDVRKRRSRDRNSEKYESIYKMIQALPEHPLSKLYELYLLSLKHKHDRKLDAIIKFAHADRERKTAYRVKKKVDSLVEQFKKENFVLNDFIERRFHNASYGDDDAKKVLDEILRQYYNVNV
jgi:hypothetical protein